MGERTQERREADGAEAEVGSFHGEIRQGRMEDPVDQPWEEWDFGDLEVRIVLPMSCCPLLSLPSDDVSGWDSM